MGASTCATAHQMNIARRLRTTRRLRVTRCLRTTRRLPTARPQPLLKVLKQPLDFITRKMAAPTCAPAHQRNTSIRTARRLPLIPRHFLSARPLPLLQAMVQRRTFIF